MFKKIKFDLNKYPDIYVIESEDSNILDKLSKINILIGPNSSSKSRFIRTLFLDDEFKFEYSFPQWHWIKLKLEGYYKRIDIIFQEQNIADADETLSTIGKLINEAYFNLIDFRSAIEKCIKRIELIKANTSLKSVTNKNQNVRLLNTNYVYTNVTSAMANIETNWDEVLQKLSHLLTNLKTDKIYIPILRGLRPIQIHNKNEFTNSEDSYKKRTIKDYFVHENQSADLSALIDKRIFTGLHIYEDIKNNLLNKRHKRESIKKFEEFLSETFFDNRIISLIPNVDRDVLEIGIGSEVERPIYEIGDGIQALIVLLYPLFMNQNENRLIFIEEPEIYLHPGMQRIFLETLMKKEFANFQFFITTHSNHFLDITLDLENISVYSFKKHLSPDGEKTRFEIENNSREDLKILDMIGVRNSSIFLSNCTIWVEGITDRLYLKRYLEIYQDTLSRDNDKFQKFREDFHFSFIEYGGGNVVHWSFNEDNPSWEKIKASRISNKIYLIADTDNTHEQTETKKAARIKKFKLDLRENFRLIDGREIENTISPEILMKTISKMDGKKIIKITSGDLKIDQYKYKQIGDFVQKTFKDLNKTYKSKSGTINNKVDFCKVAINQMNDVTDLSPEGLKLAEDIYSFIKRNN